MDHKHTFLATQGHGGPPRMSVKGIYVPKFKIIEKLRNMIYLMTFINKLVNKFCKRVDFYEHIKQVNFQGKKTWVIQ